MSSNVNGTGKNNNGIASYNAAINMMTDPWVVNTNILAIPGIREPIVTNNAAKKVRDYGKAIYLMDIPQYDEDVNRLFDDKKVKPDVEKTREFFSGRGLDNNYAAAYFPDVQIDDEINTQRVTVPPSVAAIAALGFNDRVAFPWFAPAGFNRAALNFVKNVEVRLSAEDRDNLYTTRINPIATFPREGFVIWGQKTLQVAKSALDRINVRRLLLEVKRIIGGIALNLVFEPNNAQTRAAFVKQATLQLGIIQTAAGVESFSVVMDSSNNKAVDINANRMNGRIVIVPTRAVEFIAVDFIITPAGVEFT
jgi:phage tail sheath protein FI